MSGRDHALAYQRLRAPRSAGAALIDPPLAAAADLLTSNRELLLGKHLQLWGRSLAAASQQARNDLLAAACTYTAAYRDIPSVNSVDESRPIVLAGHQPELFHAGVWFKNFVLSSLGRRCSAHAVNLLIDNDALRAASIRVPGGAPQAPVLNSVAFDRSAADIPFEVRNILDPECFASFGSRGAEVLAPLVLQPLLRELWPLVCQAARRSANIGRCLAEGRHRLEETCGLSTLEVPLSEVCESSTFRWFTAGILTHIASFREIYNSSLTEYRRVNRIRSRSHPVPDLASEQGYLEAPFWMWTASDPRRRRLFVLLHKDRLEVTDRDRVRLELPADAGGDVDAAVHGLETASAAGIRVRPRALMTTLYARLLLSDLFLHGIGGAKYDQLTDAIMARYFGITPPAYLTATATLRLPLEIPVVSLDDVRRLDRQVREQRFHPERFITNNGGDAQRLIADKLRWLAAQPALGEGRGRHQGIVSANLALQAYLVDQRRQLEDARADLQSRLQVASLLGSREFSFCLFPPDNIVPTLSRICE